MNEDATQECGAKEIRKKEKKNKQINEIERKIYGFCFVSLCMIEREKIYIFLFLSFIIFFVNIVSKMLNLKKKWFLYENC